MKEFERERRLLQREHRKKASQEKESLENLE
jgi:hypothetical protein